ncbi:MAG: TonB family protein [Betaproteobacteria bacterium]
MLASFFLHLAALLSIGHAPPFAAAWQAPSFQLTVSLAPVPGQAARDEPLTQRAISRLTRSEPRSGIEVPSPASVPTNEPAMTALHDAAPTATSTPEFPVSLDLPPGVHYFPSKEVDVAAQAINDVMLHYPLAAYRDGIAGEVKMRVFINEKGAIDDVTIIDAEPKNTFDDAAFAAAAQLLYTPAIKDGLAVKSVKVIAIVFDPSPEPLQ